MFLGETQRKILPSTCPQGLNLEETDIMTFTIRQYVGHANKVCVKLYTIPEGVRDSRLRMINFNWREIKGISI